MGSMYLGRILIGNKFMSYNHTDLPKKQLEDLINSHQECHSVFNPKNYGYAWFNDVDLIDSMRNAIIIRVTQALTLIHWADDALNYRELMMAVLARKPYQTKNTQIQGLIIAASQMVSNNWETRQTLIDFFLIKD